MVRFSIESSLFLIEFVRSVLFVLQFFPESIFVVSLDHILSSTLNFFVSIMNFNFFLGIIRWFCFEMSYKGASLNPIDNPLSPLALHPNDNSTISIVMEPLDGSDFYILESCSQACLECEEQSPSHCDWFCWIKWRQGPSHCDWFCWIKWRIVLFEDC